jgi:hypothetical protein
MAYFRKGTGYCQWCHKRLDSSRPDALYHPGACRQAAYRARHRSPDDRWELVCEWCGKKFTSEYWRKYHNDACKQAAYRARKKAGD